MDYRISIINIYLHFPFHLNPLTSQNNLESRELISNNKRHFSGDLSQYEVIGGIPPIGRQRVNKEVKENNKF